MSEVMVQPIEYLGLAEALTGSPPKESVIVITIRPDPPCWRPHNIAIARAQAERLWEDLGTVLNRSLLLLVCGLLATTGCSGRVEVESQNWASSVSVSPESQVATGEKARTAVEIALLQSRLPEPVPTPKPPALPPPPKPVAPEVKPLNVSGNTFVFNFRGGDTHYHSDIHLHIHEAPPPRVQERITVHREVETPPRRPVDERCQRMTREHEERVRSWKAFPN